eukprot:9304313-Lingulodinium_polyedra.AAC.1
MPGTAGWQSSPHGTRTPPPTSLPALLVAKQTRWQLTGPRSPPVRSTQTGGGPGAKRFRADIRR